MIVTGTLKVVGMFLLDGITTITGALTSTGTALFSGAFTSRGTTRFEGDTTEVGAHHVQGNQDITGTLAVKGAATLENSLTLTGSGKIAVGLVDINPNVGGYGGMSSATAMQFNPPAFYVNGRFAATGVITANGGITLMRRPTGADHQGLLIEPAAGVLAAHQT